MGDIILTINAGSSSVKFSAQEIAEGKLTPLASGLIDGIGGKATFSARKSGGEKTHFVLDQTHAAVDHKMALTAVLDWMEDQLPGANVVGVGHRVVHGGPNYAQPVLVTTETFKDLKALEPLAPLHQPYNLAGVEAAIHAFPHAAQVACFDTAFHRKHPFIADTFALPRQYYDEGVRRYGFHGLSYEFIHRILRYEEPVLARGKVIVAHLGNGASLCAINAGRSVASTMGFTALDGLPMGTRCGQLDPGVVLYLMSEKKMSAAEITDLLYKNSGLKGMSGISNDMRDLEASTEQSAKDAIDYFVSRVRREIGGLSAVLGGLDCIVLTGGIGENAVNIRRAILKDMEWFGIQIDEDANARNERVISEKGSPTVALILKTDEERMIAAHTAELLGLKQPIVPAIS
ncbi:acetate/propionate family kinase [Rhodoblastus acidophilus]|uniref:Acetate kinase n=1 Tax=Candidatus Rhodoblastus alkanivorans TaxID=2954117 RepID=A0ABS9ZA81_9HYPH|nr:acetate/propionate family kinase [Candidatus Rhodoblastus alkanivorans]MCI4677247.1 acetate/propionate family kinase [Candidatus Rhodoblastus alkanivorans]MCI4684599.1 acetate/propionate family kinase [Candidatus Rhodoblastus alkanivorans]MDI4641921.1 acetate/propionate family kinase [Rhodoblastus acidophilus]